MRQIQILIFSFVLLIGLGACTKSKLDPAYQATSIEKIKAVLFAQQDAWNEGDLEKFMKGYWKSDDLSFIGKKGVTKGWDTTLANYKRGYPDLDAMGKLTFDIIETKMLSRNNCMMVGKFTLNRKNDQPSGYFTLIWEYIDGRWVIISDHTSG